ncbi:hypothetical protein [Ideonella sp. YS5]|uniref:hypothetical protein n=1 Tax=Ideonella sp. YS5 TaxID=3453714 RepID=UPI003EE87AF4
MQDTVISNSMQPFAKLAQENMAALTTFATSPEVVAQGTNAMAQMLQRSTQAASSLSDSNAYARLMQALMKNYTEFFTEVGQSALQMMSEGQSALVRRTQEATESVAEAATTRGRRSR